MPQRRSKLSRRKRRAICSLVGGVCTLLTLSCNRSKVGAVETAHADNAPARGEHVVIEQMAAVFFEGRVLSVDGERLRVQTATDGDSLNVAASDVYRLGGSRAELHGGQLAICGGRAAEWTGCRIERAHGSEVRAHDAEGRLLTLPLDRVLVPTPVTELNLRKHFERARERESFVRAVTRAGRPRVPQGWSPALRERVLAHHGSGWFSGRVQDIDDEVVSVLLDADRRVAELGIDSVIPEPPYARPAKRGGIVLARPALASMPWSPNKVVAVNGAELEVSDVSGERRALTIKDVVPLGE